MKTNQENVIQNLETRLVLFVPEINCLVYRAPGPVVRNWSSANPGKFFNLDLFELSFRVNVIGFPWSLL